MADFPFLQGAGAVAPAFAGADWGQSPVGPPDGWSVALKAALALILPAKAEIVLFWGPDFVVFYNEAYASTIGLKHPHALGRPACEHRAGLWNDLGALLSRVRDEGVTMSVRDRPFYIERNGAGETVHFDISYSAVREADGVTGGVLCIVSETTLRVRAQRHPVSERERLAQMFEQAPSFMAMLEGPDHRFALANPSYRQLLGRQDILGLSVREAAPELVAQGFVDLLDRVYASGLPFRARAPLELAREEGGPLERFHLDFVYQPIKDAAGRVTGIFVEGVDVTESVRAAADLAESEAKFRSFAQMAPNQFWTATPEGVVDYANDQTYLYAGWPVSPVEGVNWEEMLHPDDRATMRKRWGRALRTGELYEVELRLRRHDGAFRWHLARALPIRDAEGCVRRWVGANTDIQDQKDVAATLADVNASLERRVAERTRQLGEAEEALRQSQKMEAVGQLTGGIAHDFNNLLQAISGSLDRVRRLIANGRFEDVERFLKAAEEGAARAASLTHRLLAFSRRQTLDPRPTDVNQLVAGMADLVNRTVGPAIEVEVIGATGLWTTRVDVSQLENALLNLCINARDAMPEGGRLIVETANRSLDGQGARGRDMPPGEFVALSVTDTGVGMPDHVIERAFDPFFTTKPIGQGTGLGLSMIYGFVRQSGGQVRLHSQVGQGTSVTLFLPRHLGDAENAPRRDPEKMERGAGETVLVVDDEEPVRMLVTEVLSESAYRTLEARDGRTAMEILKTDVRIDLLVTDVGLPGGMNGRQLADAAREMRPGLKILFITGYAENAVVGAGHLPPGMAVLVKPFAMAALGAKIRDVLQS